MKRLFLTAAMATLSGASTMWSPAVAAVTVYTSQAAFAAAAGPATNTATFESFSNGVQGQTLVDAGILFTSLPGGHPQHDVYIARPNNLTNTIQNSTYVLTADGDENFQIQLNGGGTFGSLGFDFISNQYNSPTITLFGVGNVSLGTFTITNAKNAYAYFGAVSDTPIAYARTTVDRGYIQDTAYDNVAIGPLTGAAVPEPSTWSFMLFGFAAVGSSLRRRSARARVRFA